MIYNKHLLEFLERVSCNNPLALKMTIHSSPPTCAFHLHQSDGERVTFANHGTMHQVDWNGKSLPCPARTRFDSCNVWLWHPAFALLDFSISELALPRVSHGKELFSGRHKKWHPSLKEKIWEKFRNKWKLEIFWNKMGSIGCKWSSLNDPGTENPLSHSILKLDESPISHY